MLVSADSAALITSTLNERVRITAGRMEGLMPQCARDRSVTPQRAGITAGAHGYASLEWQCISTMGLRICNDNRAREEFKRRARSAAACVILRGAWLCALAVIIVICRH